MTPDEKLSALQMALAQTNQRLDSAIQLIGSINNRVDGLVIRQHDLNVLLREQITRIDVLDNFIKEQFPQHFAGDVGTVIDDDLKPIPILFGAPQEFSEKDEAGNVVWYRLVDGKKVRIGDGDGSDGT